VTALRLATFNLCSGRSVTDGSVDPDRLSQAVAALDVDVLAVQEVDLDQPRSGGVDQLALVASALGAVDGRFVPAVTGTPGTRDGFAPVRESERTADGRFTGTGPAYGVGLVSRLPVLAWRVKELGASRATLPLLVPAGPGRRPRLLLVPDEPRVAVAAVVQTDAGPVTVISTHLSFAPVTAVRQLRALRRWAATLPGPRVLAGDLNLPGTVPGRISGWTPLALAPTFPSPAPRVQLDHLLTDHPGARRALPASATQSVVSDHRPLRADLDLGAAT
jgi:endonuclease/exonuclease/phosphatase family metal-dependent hydrolase